MVLESLISAQNAEEKRKKMLWLGGLFFIIAAVLSMMVFEAHASMLVVFLTALAAVPLMYNIIKYEEGKDLNTDSEKVLLKEHSKALWAFMYLFISITITSALVYVALPWDTVSNLFLAQTETLTQIRGSVTGLTFNAQVSHFGAIFFNNVKVMIFAILFSFVFGAGAIFVLTWNATVIGAAIGSFIRGNFALYADLLGFDKVAKYFHVITVGLFKYAIHGIPEILAYFIAALAGGIISVAVIKKDYRGREFERVVLDSADLLLIAIGVLFIAAILEVFVTPLVFPF